MCDRLFSPSAASNSLKSSHSRLISSWYQTTTTKACSHIYCSPRRSSGFYLFIWLKSVSYYVFIFYFLHLTEQCLLLHLLQHYRPPRVSQFPSMTNAKRQSQCQGGRRERRQQQQEEQHKTRANNTDKRYRNNCKGSSNSWETSESSENLLEPVGREKNMGGCVLFLSSMAGSYVNGHLVVFDGVGCRNFRRGQPERKWHTHGFWQQLTMFLIGSDDIHPQCGDAGTQYGTHLD